MLVDLERYSERNIIEVNTKKTKEMVCRNGEKVKNEIRSTYKRETLEVVGEHRYLGCWFNYRENNNTQAEMLSQNSKRTINMTWRIMKRAKVNTLGQRMLLMNVMGKAGGLYGIEIWGWGKWVQMERVKGKLVKMVLRVNKNTPNYLSRTESEKRNMELETRRSAGGYLVKVMGMEDERWPRICLRDEAKICIREILNGEASRWGKARNWRKQSEERRAKQGKYERAGKQTKLKNT